MPNIESEHSPQHSGEQDEFKELAQGPFKDFIQYVSENLVEDEEYSGEVVYFPTLERINHYFQSDDRSRRHSMALAMNQIRPLRNTFDLPLRTVGDRITRRQLTDHNTMYISASYLYASMREPVEKVRGHQNAWSVIQRARELWGEHPIGAHIDGLLESVPEEKKKVKRPVKEKEEDVEMEPKKPKFPPERGNISDLDELMLEQADSDLVKRWISIFSDPLVYSRFVRSGVIDWAESNIPYSTAVKIDYIRRAHKHTLFDSGEQIDIERDDLREGLMVVMAYLEKYDEIPTLKALYELVKDEVSKNPQKYSGEKE